MARQSSRQGAPRFPIKPNLAVAFELRFWIIQGLERGPEEVQSFPAGENVPDLGLRLAKPFLVGSSVAVLAVESYLERKPFLSCTCVPTSAAGETLSVDRLKAVEDFRSNQIPCSGLLLL